MSHSALLFFERHEFKPQSASSQPPIYSPSLCPCVVGFDELLTPAEKAKLYTAIGYSETAANPNLPKNVSHTHRAKITFLFGSPSNMHLMFPSCCFFYSLRT